MRTRSTIGVILAIVLLVGAALTACSPAANQGAAPPIKAITIAAASMGGTATNWSIAAAAVLNKHYPEVSWTVRSGSTGATLGYIMDGTIKMGVTGPTNYLEKYGPGKEAESRLRMLAFTPPLWFFWVFPKDSPWNRLEDVPKGTKIGSGQVGTFLLAMNNYWAEAIGRKDYYNIAPMGKSDQTSGWRDGSLKVIFHSGSVPSSLLIELKNTSQGIKAAGVPADQRAMLEKLAIEKGAMVADLPLSKLAPDIFKNDVVAMTSYFPLVVRDDFPEDMAYKIVKVLHENRDELVAANPYATDTTLENIVKFGIGSLKPHAGVARYLKEKGLLK